MKNEYSDDELIHSDFFKGLSRQPQIFGVNYYPSILNFLSWIVLFIGSGKLIFLLLLPISHFVFSLIGKNNPDFFSDIWIWMTSIMDADVAEEHNGEITFSHVSPNRFDH